MNEEKQTEIKRKLTTFVIGLFLSIFAFTLLIGSTALPSFTFACGVFLIKYINDDKFADKFREKFIM